MKPLVSRFILFSYLFFQNAPALAQDDIEAEVNSAQRPVEVIRPIYQGEESDRQTNRYPKDEPLFVKPPGPVKGGSIRVPHPRAADGLMRINQDGSYQYRTKFPEKSHAGTFKITSMSTPDIRGSSGVTYDTMYGDSELVGVQFDYEWQAFRRFGSLGLQVGSGFWTASAKGSFQRNPAERSEEAYNIFIVPLSAYLNYRFEYSRRQWVVPFVKGGGVYYGLVEIRDDGKAPALAGAPAAGGGGGLMFSISRLDTESAFRLSQEYGVADLWLTLEAQVLQGLNSDIDFSTHMISAGITADF